MIDLIVATFVYIEKLRTDRDNQSSYGDRNVRLGRRTVGRGGKAASSKKQKGGEQTRTDGEKC